MDAFTLGALEMTCRHAYGDYSSGSWTPEGRWEEVVRRRNGIFIDQAKTVWKVVLDIFDQPPQATIMGREHFSCLFRGAMREKIWNSKVSDAICNEYGDRVSVTVEVEGRPCDCITLDRWIVFWLRYNKLEENDEDDVDREEEEYEDLR